METIVPIDTDASGDLTLAAATSGIRKRLVSMFVRVVGEYDFTFKSGSTALTGAMKRLTGTDFEFKRGEHPLHTAAGQALVLTLVEASAGSVRGWAVVEDLKDDVR